jgi:DNA polymerase
MRLITGDFETYYSRTFSLSKITTEEYIRSDEYETIGISIKVDDAPAEWFTGTHEEIKNWLQQFPWDDAMFVAHNAMFDAAILSWRFDIHPKVIADTLSMARAWLSTETGHSLAALVKFFGLGEKGNEVVNALGKHRLDFSPSELDAYAAYCINDTELTYKLFHILADVFPKEEMKLIDLTIKMFSEPVLELNDYLLENHLLDVRDRKDALLAKVAGGDPEEAKKNIMSNNKFAELLRSYDVWPPTKISPTTGKQTFAFAKTDEGMLALQEHESVEVQTLVAARLGVKSTLEETRTERFISIARRGTLPIPLKYYAAHTSRWGGSDKINLQNLPSRGVNANTLKKSILPPKGYVIIDADSAQIEARVLAWMAGQTDLVDGFAQKKDVYKMMASAIYGKPVEEIDTAQRFVGKTTILGAGYGLGAKKFQLYLKQANVAVEYDEAKHIIDTYRYTYPAIPALWAQGDRSLGALIDGRTAEYGKEGVVNVNGFLKAVVTPNRIPLKYMGLRRSITNGKEGIVYTSRTGITGIWGGKFTENIIQHLARVIIGSQMLRIAKRYKVVLTVHDAVAIIARKEEAEEAQAYVETCMRWVPSWAEGLPLNCESGIGDSYGDC